MNLTSAPPVYERILYYDEAKDIQIRLVVNSFRGIEYLHLRRYYRDFDGNWSPSVEGVAYPLDFENSKELFIGMMEVLSLAESKELLETHFKEVLDNIYLK